MIMPAVAVGAAIVMGPLAGSGVSHAPGTTGTEPASRVTAQTVVPDKHGPNQCWRKKHNTNACIPLIGGGYVSSPPGQLITPTGGGYVSTPPGVAMPPMGGGYVLAPPGVAIPPSG